MHKVCFYVNLSCEHANCLINLALSSEGWPFLIECLFSFSNCVGHFWPFFIEGLAFFEKINLATL